MALALPELFGAHGQFPTSFRASPDFGRDRWRRHRAFCDPCRSPLQYANRGDAMFLYRVDQLLTGFVRARRIPMNFRVYDSTDPGQLNYLIALTRLGEIEAVDSSASLDDAQTVRHSVDFAGRKILVVFDLAPDLVQIGIHEAIIVGCLGLMLTGTILWGMYYFMRSSRRLAFEIATNNSMKAS